MKSAFFIVMFLTAAVFGLSAAAQTSTEIVAPGATVTTPPGANITTIVQTPGDTTITKITGTGTPSQIFKLKDGRKLEVDSDNSAYIVYDDGARITAPDGILTLLGGTTMTIRDGKRIP